MIALDKTSGLPIEVSDELALEFGPGAGYALRKAREFSFLRGQLKDPFSAFSRREVYHVYEGAALDKDREKVRAAGLRYDLTVIPPGLMGDEMVKTFGYYHSFKLGTNLRYPEVCEVVSGRAFFLLQHASPDLERIYESILVEASRGDKVVIPPGYGVVKINPAADVLILSRWKALIAQDYSEQYDGRNGACYYVSAADRLTASGGAVPDFEFAPNLSYPQVPELKFAAPRDLPQFDLLSAIPMYFTAARDLSTLDFLTNPENYPDDLVKEKLFVVRQNIMTVR